MDVKDAITKTLNKNKEKEQEVLSIFDNAVKSNTLPVIQLENMPLLLEPGEVVHWHSSAVLSEEREYFTGYGVGTTIAGIGIAGGKATKQGKIGKRDSGGLTLTSRRVIFDGGFGAINYSLPEIVSISETKKNISLTNKLTNKIHIYGVDYPNVWATYIKMAVNRYHQSQPIDLSSKKFCKNCGAPLSNNSNFCVSCGAKL